jgi:hypothetical protein
MRNNAEMRDEKNERFLSILKNRAVNSELSVTQENSHNAELGIRAISILENRRLGLNGPIFFDEI